jgi:hypothetical protein
MQGPHSTVRTHSSRTPYAPRHTRVPARQHTWLLAWLTALSLACGDYSRKPSQGDEYCSSHPESSDCRYERCEAGHLASCQEACELGVMYGCQRLGWECEYRESEYCPADAGLVP